MAVTKATVSSTVLNIFQLAATKGMRMVLHRDSGFGTRDSGGTADGAPRPRTRTRESYLSVRAATPGSTVPPRNSSDAPPPVEMCVISSVTPALCDGRHRVAAADDGRARHARPRPSPPPWCRRRTGWSRTRPSGRSRPRSSPSRCIVGVERDGLRADVEAHPVADRRVVDRERRGRRRRLRSARPRRGRPAAPGVTPRAAALRHRCRAPRRACRPRPATCRPAVPFALKNV